MMRRIMNLDKIAVNKKQKILFLLGICLVISILLESIIMLGKSVSPTNDPYVVPLDTLSSSITDGMEYRENGVHIFANENNRIAFELDFPIESISLQTTTQNIVEGCAILRDDGMKYYDQYGREFILQPGEHKVTTFKLESWGNAKYIGLEFDQGSGEFDIESITLNESYKPFNWGRVAIVFLLCACIIFLYINRKKIIDISNVRILIAIICILSLGISAFIRQANSHANWQLEYTEENLGHSIYCYMLDSFYKGIPYLDIEVDEKLNTLENIYDRSERDAAGCDYKWDYAFYQGKYYSYYGATPLFLVYIPYTLITGMLPNDSTVGFILADFCIIMLGILIYQIIKLFKLKASLPLMAISVMAVFSGSLIFSMQACANTLYNLNLATIFSIEFLMCMIIMLYHADTLKTNIIFSILSAIGCVLIVESRPSAVIPVMCFSIPLIYKMLTGDAKSLRIKKMIVSGGGGCITYRGMSCM